MRQIQLCVQLTSRYVNSDKSHSQASLSDQQYVTHNVLKHSPTSPRQTWPEGTQLRYKLTQGALTALLLPYMLSKVNRIRWFSVTAWDINVQYAVGSEVDNYRNLACGETRPLLTLFKKCYILIFKHENLLRSINSPGCQTLLSYAKIGNLSCHLSQCFPMFDYQPNKIKY